MKKLALVAALAALAVPSFAADVLDERENEDTLESIASTLEDDGGPVADTTREAVWPAFIAFCDWPETPDLVGLRFTIPFSSKQETVTGIDIGFWGDCHDAEGIQLSVLRNKVRDTFGGLQVGVYNSVNRADLFSIQVGLWNEAESFRGIQCGLVNLTGDAQGFQIGVINRAETMYGFQVGLINVIRDAEIPVLPLLNIGF